MERIGILGAGAAGSYLGAFMTRAGEDATLIDPWPENVEVQKAKGIAVTGSQGPFTQKVRILHLHELQSVNDPFDIIFIAMKSYDTLWAARLMEPYLKAEGCMVSSQNCMNDETIASVVGPGRAIGCVMSVIEVAMWEPGVVTRGGPPGKERGHHVFRVGELAGPVTPRVKRIVELTENIDAARATSNIWGERWAKLAANCMSNPTGAMSGLGSNGQADNVHARRLRIHTIREVVQTAQAHNVAIEQVMGVDPEVWLQIDQSAVFEEMDNKFQAKGHADWQASMGQDVKKGRRTENEFMSGLVLRKAREVGLEAPICEAARDMMREVEAGRVKQHPDNITRVLERVGLA